MTLVPIRAFYQGKRAIGRLLHRDDFKPEAKRLQRISLVIGYGDGPPMLTLAEVYINGEIDSLFRWGLR